MSHSIILTDTEDDTELDQHEDGENSHDEHNLDTDQELPGTNIATEDTGGDTGQELSVKTGVITGGSKTQVARARICNDTAVSQMVTTFKLTIAFGGLCA